MGTNERSNHPGARNNGPTQVVLHARYLEGHAAQLAALVSPPIVLTTTHRLSEAAVLRALGEAEIAITGHWTAAMGRAARRLRFLQVSAGGVDQIDAAAIPEGVLVANCYEHEGPIAEYVLMMCMALCRHLLEADRTIRRGDWRLLPARGRLLRAELRGRTIGIVGVGHIGRAVAGLAAAFGMRVIGIDTKPIPDQIQRSLGLAWLGTPRDLERLLRESDFVVIAVPLNEQTRGLIGARELQLLKPDAYLINPARGEIVDEQALFEALRARSFAGAALDTWWQYPDGAIDPPPSRYPFAELDNVIMTPHNSGTTLEMVERRVRVIAENVNRFLRGDPVPHVVPELSRA
jgi:phosphoglycerate dehydrogenase-like enzyme